jgi:hypothetical protein
MENRMTRSNSKSRLTRPVLLIAGTLFAAGALANTVQLEVNDSETALTYGAGSSHGRCPNDPSPGCVKVSGKSSIRFVLVGDRQCASGDRWTLTGVQLGGENSGGKGSWGNLSPTAAYDFDADPGSGWANTGQGSTIAMSANNSEAYSIWYRVAAECDGNTIYFDPRVVNDGTGN